MNTLNARMQRRLYLDQAEWLQSRKSRCKAKRKCYLDLYTKRLSALENFPPLEPEPELISLGSYIKLNDANGNVGSKRISISRKLKDDSSKGISNSAPISCEFPKDLIQANTIVYAAGAYQGQPTGLSIDSSGHTATKFDVRVHFPGKPVALLLGAYEPSIWNISWTSRTKIVAVAVSGYHKQVIVGVPNETPIINSTWDNKSVCDFTYVTQKRKQQVEALSVKLYGRTPSTIVDANKGKIELGVPTHSFDRYLTSSDRPAKKYTKTSLLPAGKAGLDLLLQRGQLRKATINDYRSWLNLGTHIKDRSFSALVKSKPPSLQRKLVLDRSYVIRKEMTIPRGLNGSNAVTFFLGKGVVFPTGELGHSSLYDFNSRTCYGLICKAI